MSFRNLIEPNCGAQNPLMRLGTHLTEDAARKDEGVSGMAPIGRPPMLDENPFVNEFLGEHSAPPNTFIMHDLMKELVGPSSMTGNEFENNGVDWAREFSSNHLNFELPLTKNSENEIWGTAPHGSQSMVNWTDEFLDLNANNNRQKESIVKQDAELLPTTKEEEKNYSEFMKLMHDISNNDMKINEAQSASKLWIDEFKDAENKTLTPPGSSRAMSEDWVSSFQASKTQDVKNTESYNTQFWNRLQDEWKKISEQDTEHPWLNEFSEYYDPYKEYKFDEEHALIDVENAFEKGKGFLEQGDIPSAVLCFEYAVQKAPENSEIWELLGLAQAENEKDPNAIAAMKKSLELKPGNLRLLMALAVSYTNESMQNLALKSLVTWMSLNVKYHHLVPTKLLHNEHESTMASSLIQGPELKEVENLFINAVQQNSNEIDADIQEALGVLFNLSSEYNKAVDCFQAALQVRPDAKTWNRLGASLANGNRSVEAVEAYKRALDIHPGYIRARYNVGIICINLNSYNEAAEHFLTALNHQANSSSRSGLNVILPTSKMSDTIWSTLRMTISLMGRHDLQPAIENRNLSALNQAFGIHD